MDHSRAKRPSSIVHRTKLTDSDHVQGDLFCSRNTQEQLPLQQQIILASVLNL
jgi:hypothetical protein